MEKSAAADEEKREMKEPLLKDSSTKGGMKPILLILGNGTLEKIGSYGLLPNMTLYLTNLYHLEMITVSNIVTIWLAAMNITPVIGAVLSDGYFGRYNTMGFGCIVSVLGVFLLWLTTVVPGLRPPTCYETNSHCSSTTTSQLLLLCTSFAMIAIGGGGIRSSSLAFGIDQFVDIGDHRKGGVRDRFFAWYYAMYMFSMFIGYTLIVYVQDKLGWRLGFGISVVLLILATLCFFVGSPFYVKANVKTNLIAELLQVVVASFKKRHIKTRTSDCDDLDMMYHRKKGSTLSRPTDNLRFLNKACTLQDADQELNPDGTARDAWSLCTIEQVEDLKAFLRTMPIASTGVIAFIAMNQGSFQVVQAKATNRHIFGKFEIPAGSFGTFSLLCVALWVPFYDQIFLPVVSKIRGKQTQFSTKKRMGAGMLLILISMIVTAAVEGMRISRAKNPESHGKMSALWIVPQYCLLGSAEALLSVAQGEFYIKEFPKSMWSIAATLCLVEMSIAGLLTSCLMSTIDDLTKRGGGKSWISDDINEAHFDYYFWIVSAVIALDCVYFLFCCRSYGPCKEDQQPPAAIEEDQDVVV